MCPVEGLNISRRRENVIVFSLCLMIFVLFLSNDIHAPNVIEIGNDLKTSEGNIRLLFIISSFFAYSVQVVWGAVSPYYRRRKILAICAALTICGKALSIFAQNFTQMVIARVLEYSAVGGIWAIVSCICSDICGRDAKRIAKIFSIIDLLYPVAIMIGPFIGGYIGRIAGWRGCFKLMLIISSVFFAFAFVTIKETSGKLEKISTKQIINNYATLCTSKIFMLCSVLSIACWTAISLLHTNSPYCYMQYFGCSNTPSPYYINAQHYSAEFSRS